MADNMLHHGTYSYYRERIFPTAFHPPGYPLLLASLRAVKGGIPAERMLNFAALALCVLLMVRMLKGRGSVVGARWAPVLVLCYPVLFFTAGTLYPQIIATALFLLVLLMIEAYPATRARMLAVGAVQGFLLLVSPSFILVLPLVLAMPYILRKSVPLSRVLCVAAGILLILAPWIARNYLTFHSFILLSTNGGKTLLLGNSETSAPNKGESVDLSRYDAVVEARMMSEPEVDRFYRDKALEWMAGNPQKASLLYVRKLLNYFNYRNELATKGQESRLRDLVMFFTYYPLLLLVLVRLCLIRRSPLTRFEGVLLAFYLMSALTNAVFLPRIRYRLPFDALIICLAAFSLDCFKAFICGRTAAPSGEGALRSGSREGL